MNDFGKHTPCIKVLSEKADTESFDFKMIQHAKLLVGSEIVKMTRAGIPFTKIRLAKRLRIHRNRIPNLLKSIGLDSLNDRDYIR